MPGSACERTFSGSQPRLFNLRYSRNLILLLSFLLEGFLALSFFLWCNWRDRPSLALPEPWEIVYGCCFSLPLFGLNYLLFERLPERYLGLSSFREFRELVVLPLVHELDLSSAFFVSLCAGVGEELFFRGVLQAEFGVLASAVLFSLLHFGSAVKKFPYVATVYVLIALYFSLLLHFSQSLWSVIVAHSLYDFLAFAFLLGAATRRSRVP